MINVAVLGYGTVGSGVVEVIEKNKDMVNKKSAQELEVKYISDEQGNDVFVHYSGLNMEGFKSLDEGAEVEFDVVNGAKGPQATNVTKL